MEIPHAEYLKFCGYTQEDVDKMWNQFYDQEVVEETFRNETDAPISRTFASHSKRLEEEFIQRDRNRSEREKKIIAEMTSRFRSITDEEGMRVRERLTQIKKHKGPAPEEITNKSKEKKSMEMWQKVIWQKVLRITRKSLVAKRRMYKRIDSNGQLRPMQGTEMDNANHKAIIEYINASQ